MQFDVRHGTTLRKSIESAFDEPLADGAFHVNAIRGAAVEQHIPFVAIPGLVGLVGQVGLVGRRSPNQIDLPYPPYLTDLTYQTDLPVVPPLAGRAPRTCGLLDGAPSDATAIHHDAGGPSILYVDARRNRQSKSPQR
jgi:hypothetical protein